MLAGKLRPTGTSVHKSLSQLERIGPECKRPRWAHALEICISACWFGLITGFAETGLLLLRKMFFGPSVIGSLQLSDHFPWMIPLDNLLIFACVGAPLGLLGLIRSRVVGVLAFVSLLGLSVMTLLVTIKGLYLGAAAVLAFGLSIRIARSGVSNSDRYRKLVYRTAPLLFLALGATVFWIYHRIETAERSALAALPLAKPGAPNVLLVVWDTARFSRLSMNGYQRSTTPNLERWAKRGVLFTNARSTAPWTLPSHASLFTGELPRRLKVGDDVPLDGVTPTIAEFFRDRGYQTSGIVGNTFYCNSWYGLNRGFIHYEDDYKNDHSISALETARSSALIRRIASAVKLPLDPHHAYKNAERIHGDFLTWLTRDRRPDRPFFAFLNLIDAHSPYLVPEGWRRVFSKGPETPADFQLLMDWDKIPSSKIGPREASMASDCYDDCISYLDVMFGSMLNELERQGLLENTIVVLTSDHGEEMGEHGLFGHGKSLYEPELHVPLLIIPPGGLERHEAVDAAVSLCEIPATLAEMAAPESPHRLPGESLARFWKETVSASAPASGSIISEVSIRERGQTKLSNPPPAFKGPMRSLFDGKWSLIQNADDVYELFDVENDPLESKNLAGDPGYADVLKELAGRLSRSEHSK
jgi:arylsulfatase A-like enzyme